MKRTIPFLILAFAGLGLMACETSDDNKLASAQKCMDSATTSAEAQGCMAAVDGLTGTKASRVRCAAAFLVQGFTGEKFKVVFNQLSKDNKGSQNASPALYMMSTLAFTKTIGAQTPSQYATFALGECNASGSSGLTMLAGFMSMATTMSSLVAPGGDGTMDPDALKTALDNLTSGSASAVEIGNAAIVAQGSYCATTTEANQDVCGKLNQAIADGAGDPGSIGDKLGQYLGTK